MAIAQILTTAEVREYVGDYQPNNYLLNSVEFTDARITLAMELAVSEFNAITPLSKVSLANFPSKGLLLDGTMWKLLSGMAQQLARNTMEYSDGGLSIPIEERSALYLQQAGQYQEQFLTNSKNLKIQMNLDSGWGFVQSDEAFFPVW
jgi:hypothetical protein